jgi:hypothetical protein
MAANFDQITTVVAGKKPPLMPGFPKNIFVNKNNMLYRVQRRPIRITGSMYCHPRLLTAGLLPGHDVCP